MNFKDQIINGDCLTVLKQLPGASIDFVLTDPPYLVNYHSRDGRSIAGDDTATWLKPACAEICRVLKPHRLFVSFYGWHKADVFLTAWRQAGFRPVAHLVWVKPYASSVRIVSRHHEQAYVLARGAPRPAPGHLPDVLGWRYTGNHLHPTQKPVSALRPLIGAFSRYGELVLDPFAGSGSTAVAAKQLGRHYLGIELESRYCGLAEQRLRQETTP